MRKHLEQATAVLLRFELTVVILATSVGMASSSLLPMAVTVIGFTLSVRLLHSLCQTGRFQIAHTPADLPILILIGSIFINLWATPKMDITLPQVLRLLSGVGLFLALTNNEGIIANHASLVAASLAMVGVILTVSMPFTVEWSGVSKLAFIPSAIYQQFALQVSDGINPNVMAGAIVLFLPVAVAQLLRSSSLAHRALYTLAVVIMISGLVLAESRSALFAAVASIGVLMTIQLPRKLIGLLACLFALLAVILAASGQMFGTQLNAFVNRLLTTNDALSGSSSRIEIWSRAIYIIQDFPFTGIGMGLFAPVVDLLYPMIITRPGIEHAHNLLLQIGVDLGLPGLMAWLSTYFVVLACLVSQLFKKPAMNTALAFGLLGAQVALITGGITDAVTWGMVRSAPLVWGLWGLAVALWLSLSQHDYTMD